MGLLCNQFSIISIRRIFSDLRELYPAEKDNILLTLDSLGAMVFLVRSEYEANSSSVK
jgi:hypothetical protein